MGYTVYQLISFGLVWYYLDDFNTHLEHHLPQMIPWTRDLIIIILFLGQIFAVIGFIGIFKQDHFLVAIYIGLLFIQCILNIGLSSVAPIHIAFHNQKDIISSIIVLIFLCIFYQQIQVKAPQRDHTICMFTLTPIPQINVSSNKQDDIQHFNNIVPIDPPPPYRP